MKKIGSITRTAFTLLVLVTLLFGGLYPLLVFGVAQTAFKEEANGSLVEKDGNVIGSTLLAQEFKKPGYFWSRPSAAAYNAAGSSASNMNPGNPKLLEDVKSRVAALQNGKGKIPVDLVTASASGLDPHISLAAALYQIPRVAAARGMKESDVRELVEKHAEHWLGLAYVNVLKLNMALDNR